MDFSLGSEQTERQRRIREWAEATLNGDLEARERARTFDRDVSEPLLYDVVFNSSCLPIEEIAELTVEAWRRKAATGAAGDKAVRKAS